MTARQRIVLSIMALVVCCLYADVWAEMPEDGREKLRWLRRQPGLSISTLDADCPKEFRLSVEMHSGSGDGTGMRAMVHKRDDRVGILLMTTAGVPYAYLSDDLCCVVDRDQAGRLLVARDGEAGFMFALSPEHGGLLVGMRALKIGRAHV